MRVRNGPSPTTFRFAMLDRTNQGCTTIEAKETIILADANARRSAAVDGVTERTMLQPSERDVMLAAVPNLRAFAISLSGNVDRADDLVQGTLLRAIASINSFKP